MGQHLFEANINGTVDFYGLKMKFEMQMSHFEGKVVNHATRKCLEGYILDDVKFPCQLIPMHLAYLL